MESKTEAAQSQFRSGIRGPKLGEMGFGFEEMQGLISVPPPPPDSGSSFTALLELPAPQAVELLVNSSDSADESPAKPILPGAVGASSHFHPPPIFPSNIGLIDRASKFSIFASADNSPENNSILSNSSSRKLDTVKQEPHESDSNPNSSSPAISNQNQNSTKRKDREKKVKESNKKSKKVVPNEATDDGGDKLPYVHVRARRGQATDSHSLAERARREKINARMKLLQELVPGCNKISGTAMVLDEIINHVQALQRQVEFLSMRLAAVNPRIDFSLDSFLAAENGSSMENSFPGMVMPSTSWREEGQINGYRQQYQQLCHFDGLHQPVWGREEDNSNFITPENSLLSFDSSANSGGVCGSVRCTSSSHEKDITNVSPTFWHSFATLKPAEDGALRIKVKGATGS